MGKEREGDGVSKSFFLKGSLMLLDAIDTLCTDTRAFLDDI